MKLLRNLTVGSRFRIAVPTQKSLNRRNMSRDDIFVVDKIFPMAPHTTICLRTKDRNNGFYSLGPNTPVIGLREPYPTNEQVLTFIGARRRKIIAYRVLWDGISDISARLSPQAHAGMKLMIAFGKTLYEATELHKLFDEHLEKFFGKNMKTRGSFVLSYYAKKYVQEGLVEEIVDDAVPSAVVDANLQETDSEL